MVEVQAQVPKSDTSCAELVIDDTSNLISWVLQASDSLSFRSLLLEMANLTEILLSVSHEQSSISFLFIAIYHFRFLWIELQNEFLLVFIFVNLKSLYIC